MAMVPYASGPKIQAEDDPFAVLDEAGRKKMDEATRASLVVRAGHLNQIQQPEIHSHYGSKFCLYFDPQIVAKVKEVSSVSELMSLTKESLPRSINAHNMPSAMLRGRFWQDSKWSNGVRISKSGYISWIVLHIHKQPEQKKGELHQPEFEAQCIEYDEMNNTYSSNEGKISDTGLKFYGSLITFKLTLDKTQKIFYQVVTPARRLQILEAYNVALKEKSEQLQKQTMAKLNMPRVPLITDGSRASVAPPPPAITDGSEEVDEAADENENESEVGDDKVEESKYDHPNDDDGKSVPPSPKQKAAAKPAVFITEVDEKQPAIVITAADDSADS